MKPVIGAVVGVFQLLRATVGYIRHSEEDLRAISGDPPRGSAAAQQSAHHGVVGTSIANSGSC